MTQQELKIITVGAEKLGRPVSVFSNATINNNLIYVAGQAGIDFTNGSIDSNFETQARQAFKNLKEVLEAAGSDLAHTLKVVVWLKRTEDFDMLNVLFKEYFPVNPPARSVPIVDLPKPEYLISIEATAVIK